MRGGSGPAVRGEGGPVAWPAWVRQPARPCDKPLPRGERDEPHPTALSGREQAGAFPSNALPKNPDLWYNCTYIGSTNTMKGDGYG